MSELIEKIKNHEVLSKYICVECRENSAEVRISNKIKEYCIVNPEKYFKDKIPDHPPPSVDFIVTALCKKHSHDHNLVELKSASLALNGEYSQIFRKFENTIEIFILEDFEDIYYSEERPFFKLFLIHNITNEAELNYLRKLFMQPINKKKRNFYIDNQNSPYELKKC